MPARKHSVESASFGSGSDSDREDTRRKIQVFANETNIAPISPMRIANPKSLKPEVTFNPSHSESPTSSVEPEFNNTVVKDPKSLALLNDTRVMKSPAEAPSTLPPTDKITELYRDAVKKTQSELTLPRGLVGANNLREVNLSENLSETRDDADDEAQPLRHSPPVPSNNLVKTCMPRKRVLLKQKVVLDGNETADLSEADFEAKYSPCRLNMTKYRSLPSFAANFKTAPSFVTEERRKEIMQKFHQKRKEKYATEKQRKLLEQQRLSRKKESLRSEIAMFTRVPPYQDLMVQAEEASEIRKAPHFRQCSKHFSSPDLYAKKVDELKANQLKGRCFLRPWFSVDGRKHHANLSLSFLTDTVFADQTALKPAKALGYSIKGQQRNNKTTKVKAEEPDSRGSRQNTPHHPMRCGLTPAYDAIEASLMSSHSHIDYDNFFIPAMVPLKYRLLPSSYATKISVDKHKDDENATVSSAPGIGPSGDNPFGTDSAKAEQTDDLLETGDLNNLNMHLDVETRSPIQSNIVSSPVNYKANLKNRLPAVNSVVAALIAPPHTLLWRFADKKQYDLRNKHLIKVSELTLLKRVMALYSSSLSATDVWDMVMTRSAWARFCVDCNLVSEKYAPYHWVMSIFDEYATLISQRTQALEQASLNAVLFKQNNRPKKTIPAAVTATAENDEDGENLPTLLEDDNDSPTHHAPTPVANKFSPKRADDSEENQTMKTDSIYKRLFARKKRAIHKREKRRAELERWKVEKKQLKARLNVLLQQQKNMENDEAQAAAEAAASAASPKSSPGNSPKGKSPTAKSYGASDAVQSEINQLKRTLQAGFPKYYAIESESESEDENPQAKSSFSRSSVALCGPAVLYPNAFAKAALKILRQFFPNREEITRTFFGLDDDNDSDNESSSSDTEKKIKDGQKRSSVDGQFNPAGRRFSSAVAQLMTNEVKPRLANCEEKLPYNRLIQTIFTHDRVTHDQEEKVEEKVEAVEKPESDDDKAGNPEEGNDNRQSPSPVRKTTDRSPSHKGLSLGDRIHKAMDAHRKTLWRNRRVRNCFLEPEVIHLICVYQELFQILFDCYKDGDCMHLEDFLVLVEDFELVPVFATQHAFRLSYQNSECALEPDSPRNEMIKQLRQNPAYTSEQIPRKLKLFAEYVGTSPTFTAGLVPTTSHLDSKGHSKEHPSPGMPTIGATTSTAGADASPSSRKPGAKDNGATIASNAWNHIFGSKNYVIDFDKFEASLTLNEERPFSTRKSVIFWKAFICSKLSDEFESTGRSRSPSNSKSPLLVQCSQDFSKMTAAADRKSGVSPISDPVAATTPTSTEDNNNAVIMPENFTTTFLEKNIFVNVLDKVFKEYNILGVDDDGSRGRRATCDLGTVIKAKSWATRARRASTGGEETSSAAAAVRRGSDVVGQSMSGPGFPPEVDVPAPAPKPARRGSTTGVAVDVELLRVAKSLPVGLTVLSRRMSADAGAGGRRLSIRQQSKGSERGMRGAVESDPDLMTSDEDTYGHNGGLNSNTLGGALPYASPSQDSGDKTDPYVFRAFLKKRFTTLSRAWNYMCGRKQGRCYPNIEQARAAYNRPANQGINFPSGASTKSDNTKTFNYQEFSQIMIGNLKYCTDESIVQGLFNNLDDDGSQSISIDEVRPNRETAFNVSAFIEALLKPVFAHYIYFGTDVQRGLMTHYKLVLFLAHLKNVVTRLVKGEKKIKKRLGCSAAFEPNTSDEDQPLSKSTSLLVIPEGVHGAPSKTSQQENDDLVPASKNVKQVTNKLFRHDDEFAEWAQRRDYEREKRSKLRMVKILDALSRFNWVDPRMLDSRLLFDPMTRRKPENAPADIKRNEGVWSYEFGINLIETKTGRVLAHSSDKDFHSTKNRTSGKTHYVCSWCGHTLTKNGWGTNVYCISCNSASEALRYGIYPLMQLFKSDCTASPLFTEQITLTQSIAFSKQAEAVPTRDEVVPHVVLGTNS